MGFAAEGDAIALVGPFEPSLAASELAKLRGEVLPERLPPIDVEAVISAQDAVREGVRAGALASAHDVAEGGLAVALAECCLAGGVGASVELDADAEALFGEGAGGFLVSAAAAALEDLRSRVAVRALGSVGGERLRVLSPRASQQAASAAPQDSARVVIDATLAELAAAHSALSELFE